MAAAALLHLSFEAGGTDETVLRICRQEPPWRVVRGFATPAGEKLAHIHNLSGGVLDGDRLRIRIDVGARAQAQVTTTGATRVYRSRSPLCTAEQEMEVRLGEGAYLEYLPDALIPFAGARYRQSTRIQLGPKAALVWWEQVAPGREAGGESFAYESLAASLEIAAGAEPLAIERWSLAPRARPVDSLARLGPFRHFGSGYICRAGEPPEYWRTLEAELEETAGRDAGPDVLWGITCLRAGGIALRGLASNGRLLRDSWLALWSAAKLRLCGRAAAIPRKVP